MKIKYHYIFLLIFLISSFLIFTYTNLASDTILLVKDFCSWKSSFLPVSTFYMKDKQMNSFFSGQLIYEKKRISPYSNDYIFPDLSIYKSNDKLIGFTNLPFPDKEIKDKDVITFSEDITSCFIIKDGIFLNPIEYVKPLLSSSVSIVNVYFLNEEEVPVAFRQNYKNNVIPILIYAYTTYLSGRYAFTANVYKIEIYLDNNLIYKRILDDLSKKKIIELLSTSSKPQFIKYIVSNVTDGEHTLKVKVYDIFDHEKEIQKKFIVKSY